MASPLLVKRSHSSEDAAGGFNGQDLDRRRMLDAARPAAHAQRAPGLLRLRSLSETGNLRDSPRAEQRCGSFCTGQHFEGVACTC
jgi:hypothetical protein